MRSRRDFIKTIATASALGGVRCHGAPSIESKAAPPSDDRAYWISLLTRLSDPVLTHLAARQLKKSMPVEANGDASARRPFTHLEAFGRLLAGIAPWLAVTQLPAAEETLRQRYSELVHEALDAATDPASPDFMNFSEDAQPLVDSAFLAQGLLRAKSTLWDPLNAHLKKQVIEALKSSRKIPTPTKNNWTLFAAMVETALLEFGEPTIEERLEGSVEHMLQWYVGDGAYADGEDFHFDYYNSFVIHPMLVDILENLRRRDLRFEAAAQRVLSRARRYGVVQERLIMPDGSFPSLGRSTTYRFGAFHSLAQLVVEHQLPESLKPSQVRCALTAVMRKMAEASGTFDSGGWLQIGFCGHQPALAESYISTGSLYLCAVALLPLGLPPTDPFWSGPACPWTAQKIWSGENLPADHALSEVKSVGLTLPRLATPRVGQKS